MNTANKRRIAGSIYLIGVVCMCYCIFRMIPYGMAGEINKVKPYFIFGAAAFVIGCPSAIAYYYYRDMGNKDPDLERMNIETDALSYIGKKPPEPFEEISGHDQNNGQSQNKRVQ